MAQVADGFIDQVPVFQCQRDKNDKKSRQGQKLPAGCCDQGSGAVTALHPPESLQQVAGKSTQIWDQPED